MLIVHLRGGLGNQLFQYAFGRHLSIINDQDLLLDTSSYVGLSPDPAKGHWSYGLSHFNISAVQASDKDVAPFAQFLKKGWRGRVARSVNNIRALRRRSYIVENPSDGMRFRPELLTTKLAKSVYLQGFWATEKYFVDVQDIIRKDLSCIDDPDDYNREIASEMRRCDSVAVHIRRGDYIYLNKGFHVLPVEYYTDAARKIANSVRKPVFYVFSDDPAWSENHVRFEHPTRYITHNGNEKNYEDLRLMSVCRHHIIANSTFSWWGAWLGRGPGQIVFAPKKFFNFKDISGTDYYPSDWNLL